MLEKYKKKRDFERTPEPKGAKKNEKDKALHFVVQKHQASRLHYDFRLELGGVLKSWAVPKGPSLDPNEKRLAMMVEDHPFEYKDFEGVIPKGNYGAGTVMVWDEGDYASLGNLQKAEQEKLLEEGLHKGHITYVLNGKKLKGEFALIKLKKAEGDAWLLIKAAKDEFAGKMDILKDTRSVKSGLSLQEITELANKSGDFWTSRTKDVDIKAPNAPFPHDIKPMMSMLAKEPFDDKDWAFEVKWDGYRAITEIENRTINIYSRNRISFNDRFPQIVHAFRSFRKNAVFDGEIVAVDKDGCPSFQLLQDYLLTKRGSLIYYVFDLLHFEGKDLTQLPLENRREILKKVLPKVPNVLLSEDIKEKGREFFAVAKAQDLEGVMAKRLDSVYEIGKRSKNWLKIKNYQQQEVVIGGFTRPRGAREDFGSLAVGVYQRGKLEYVGNVGSGFSEKLLTELRQKFEPLIQKDCPFSNLPKLNNVTWLKPTLVAEVRFQEWTKEGSMRQPVFLGLRLDKNPKEVTKERFYG